jgi:hypothetical protein
MQIIEVIDQQDGRDFLAVNALMNAHNPAYIRALDNEVNEVGFLYGNDIYTIFN